MSHSSWDNADSKCWETLETSNSVCLKSQKRNNSTFCVSNNITDNPIFTFDNVFDDIWPNEKIYSDGVHQIVKQFVSEEGNAAVITYGQSNSGKTYSMHGRTAYTHPDTNGNIIESREDEEAGLIHYIAKNLFHLIEKAKNDYHYIVRASYVEICNEEIKDLLHGQGKDINNNGTAKQPQPRGNRIYVRHDPKRGVSLNCTEIIVRNLKNIVELITEGFVNSSITLEPAHTGDSTPNQTTYLSTKSHTIFRITLERRRKMRGIENNDSFNSDSDGSAGGSLKLDNRPKRWTRSHRTRAMTSQQKSNDDVRISTLSIVDVASCSNDISPFLPINNNNANKTKAVDTTSILDDIDPSFICLSHSLIGLDAQQHPSRRYFNFRDSKLTQILQPSLTSNAKVAVICCIATDEQNIEKSKLTLELANRIRTGGIEHRKAIEELGNTINRTLDTEIPSPDTTIDEEESTQTAEYPSTSNMNQLRIKQLQRQLEMSQQQEQSLIQINYSAEKKAADAMKRVNQLQMSMQALQNKKIFNSILGCGDVYDIEKKISNDENMNESSKIVEDLRMKNRMLEKKMKALIIMEKNDEKRELEQIISDRNQLQEQLNSKAEKIEELEKDFAAKDYAKNLEVIKLKKSKVKLDGIIEELYLKEMKSNTRMADLVHDVKSKTKEIELLNAKNEAAATSIKNLLTEKEILENEKQKLYRENNTYKKQINKIEANQSHKASSIMLPDYMNAGDLTILSRLTSVFATDDKEILCQKIIDIIQQDDLLEQIKGALTKTKVFFNSHNISNADGKCAVTRDDETIRETARIDSVHNNAGNNSSQSNEKMFAVIGQQLLKHEELNNENNILKEKINELQKDLFNEKKYKKELLDGMNQLKIQQYQVEKSTRDEDHKLNLKTAELDHMKVFQSKMSEEMDLVKESKQKIETELKYLRGMESEVKKKVEVLTAEQKKLQNDNSKLKTELQNTKFILVESQQRINALTDERDSIYKAKHGLELEVERLQRKMMEIILEQDKQILKNKYLTIKDEEEENLNTTEKQNSADGINEEYYNENDVKTLTIVKGIKDQRQSTLHSIQKFNERLEILVTELKKTFNQTDLKFVENLKIELRNGALDPMRETEDKADQHSDIIRDTKSYTESSQKYDEQDAVVRELKRMNSTYRSQINELVQELKLLINERDQFLSQIFELENRLDQYDSHIFDLEKQIEKNSQYISAATEENIKINGTNENRSDTGVEDDNSFDYGTLSLSSNSEVPSDVTGESEEDIKYLVSQMNDVVSERDTLEARLKKLCKERDNLHCEVAKLKSSNVTKQFDDTKYNRIVNLVSCCAIGPDSESNSRNRDNILSSENVNALSKDGNTLKHNARHSALMQKMLKALNKSKGQQEQILDQNNDFVMKKAKMLEEDIILRQNISNYDRSSRCFLTDNLPRGGKNMSYCIGNNESFDENDDDSNKKWICNSVF